MDTRRLAAFARIVDVGSITRASAILNIAQPALSQQVAALEAQFGKPLLLRSKRGVVPTEAGRVLYRHCQLIQRQLDQAMLELRATSNEVTGFVSVGLAPLSTGSLLATGLIRTVRDRHPGIVLQINENVGGIISQLIMTGKIDMAFIYDPGAIPGVSFEDILSEDLYFVTQGPGDGTEEIQLDAALRSRLVLPSRIHTVRQVIDLAVSRISDEVRLVAEVESMPIVARVVREGLGATILPWSCASAIVAEDPSLSLRRIVKPNITTKTSLCVSDQLPMSEPAAAVYVILTEIARGFAKQSPGNRVSGS